ncbi:uncharacterized protein [Apostichopus japonicus]|uniref:uncharacterized protein n=1 Tax=Stichopus japonicus TaxID=307972 RepID=UPI003AB60672
MWQLLNGGQDDPGDQRDPSRADYSANSRNAYLSKFGAPLPAIPAENSPQPTAENQMIPYGGRRTQLSQIDQPPMVGDLGDGRVRQVEGRLSLVEQSNRALLEEVVRLQGELKAAQRRTEEALQAERQARQQLTENIRGSNDLVGQLGARLKRAEEKVADERTAVGALVNHTKQVEQAVLGSQQELVAKRDQQMTKIAELRNDLDEANRLREQLERATTTLVDELRQVKSKQDAHSIESNGTLHDIKERTKRLEEEQRQVRLENQRKSHESQHTSEQSTSLLRSQLDARLGEVRDVLMDLRNRVTTEETERRQQEQTTQLRINEIQSQVHEQSRKRDESMHALDVIQREREHAADNERLKMQGKIAEIAEEVSRKILSKEIRLREEAQQKFANIEKYLHAEQAARIAHEQAMREENEKRWGALQKLTEEEVLHVREGQKLDRHKNVGSLSKVGDVVDKLEKQQVDTKKQLEQVMKAEIKSRQSQDKQIEDKIEDVQEKLGVAISTLQQAIGGINEQVSSANTEYQERIRALIVENSQGGVRGLADLDARLVGLQVRITAQEESVDEKIQEALNAALVDKENEESKKAIEEQKEQLEEVNDWRDSAEKKLKAIRERMDELGPEIREMNRTNESIQEDMKGLVESEGKDRVRDVQMIRQEFQGKYAQLQDELETVKQKAAQEASVVPSIPISQKEKLSQVKGGKVDDATKARVDDIEEAVLKNQKKFEEMSEEITKVENSIQTVRVHLSRKIDGETKARRNEIQDLQNIFEDLKTNMSPLVSHAASLGDVFKRSDRKASRDTMSSQERDRKGSGRRRASRDETEKARDEEGKKSRPASREKEKVGAETANKPPSGPSSQGEREDEAREKTKPPSREKTRDGERDRKDEDKTGKGGKPPSSRERHKSGSKEESGSKESRDSRRGSEVQKEAGNVNNSNNGGHEDTRIVSPTGSRSGSKDEEEKKKSAAAPRRPSDADGSVRKEDGKTDDVDDRGEQSADKSKEGGSSSKAAGSDDRKNGEDGPPPDDPPKKKKEKDDPVALRKAKMKAAKKAKPPEPGSS